MAARDIRLELCLVFCGRFWLTVAAQSSEGLATPSRKRNQETRKSLSENQQKSFGLLSWKICLHWEPPRTAYKAYKQGSELTIMTRGEESGLQCKMFKRSLAC